MTRMTRALGATLAGAWVLGTLALVAPGAAAVAIFLSSLAILGARQAALGRIDTELKAPEHRVAEGDDVRFDLVIENKGFRTAHVQWRLLLPPLCKSDGDSGEADLRHGKPTRLHPAATFLLFGRTRVGPLLLRYQDPLGFVVDERVAAEAIDLRVQPNIEALRDVFMPAKQERPLFGAYEVSQPGSGFEFFGLRDYRPGDRPRDVNWKATARVGKVVVNQFQRESTVEALIIADTRAASLAGRRSQSPAAVACRMALAVANVHLAARDDARLVLLTDEAKQSPGTGSRRKDAMVDLVTDMRPQGAHPMMDHIKHLLPSLRAHTPTFIASPMVGDPTAVPAVALLRSHDMPVVVAVLRPDFGDLKGPSLEAWREAQDRAVRELRGIGARVVVAEPGVQLEMMMPMLEVDS